jgi:hypothetical protein
LLSGFLLEFYSFVIFNAGEPIRYISKLGALDAIFLFKKFDFFIVIEQRMSKFLNSNQFRLDPSPIQQTRSEGSEERIVQTIGFGNRRVRQIRTLFGVLIENSVER